MDPEVMIAILVPLAFFALIFGIVYVRNRENMALIERGINPRVSEPRPRHFVNLKWGALCVGSGLGLLIAYLIDKNTRHSMLTPAGNMYHENNATIYFALIAIGGGLGLILSYMIEKKHWDDQKNN